ncbi:MAG TPA: hypothetical protein VGG27_01475 [Magnetospirillaceae bacterium]
MGGIPSVARRGARYAFVVEDKDGRFDHERKVSSHPDGITFYWSKTSVRADFESTLQMAEWWADKHGAFVVRL